MSVALIRAAKMMCTPIELFLLSQQSLKMVVYICINP